jgi:hypothetical protein
MIPLMRSALVIGTIFYFSPERGALPGGLPAAPSLAEISEAARTAQRLSAVAPKGLSGVFSGTAAGASGEAPALRDTLSTLDRHIPWRGDGAQKQPSPGSR